MAAEACRRLGLTAVFIRIERQNKAKYLADHIIDCRWGSFSMNGREDDYLWAGPHLSSLQVVVVNAASNIYSLSDLSGMRVAVQNGSKPESIFLTNAIKDVT
ncbi:MAG: transporter substrate-binding domain-containing protein, partial [Ruminococcus sp.]|nr:transporter substrate-binding domain-containing protein [Ruminococcus sp.]